MGGKKINFDFKDKVVLITGGGAGLGLAIAQAFVVAQARLVITDIASTSLDQAVAELKNAGDDVHGVVNDASKSNQVRALVDGIVDRYGRLDIAVNNAGISAPLAHFSRNCRR